MMWLRRRWINSWGCRLLGHRWVWVGTPDHCSRCLRGYHEAAE